MIPPGEKIIETKKCRLSGKEFFVTDKDIEFYDTISPTFGGKKYPIPSPSLSFDERRRRRLAFYNQRSLYKNTCAITGKEIISRIPPESGLKVFSIDAWSDRSWDPTQFGIPVDFDAPFFDQVHHLIRVTPYQNLIGSSDNVTNNALYTNHTSELKNCYLISNANKVTEGYYSTDLKKSVHCYDCLSCSETQRSYECVSCADIYGCFFCEYVTGSRDCWLSKLLKGCTNCLACTTLSHKNNHILNREVTQQEFTQTLARYLSDSACRATIQQKYKQLIATSFSPATIQVNATHSLGDTLYNVENCTGFNLTTSTHCRYCESIIDCHNSMDVSDYGEHSELMYESVSVGRYSQNILFSSIVGKGNNIYYCLEVKKSENCFGCVNAHYIKNCILNTPYSAHEYESLCGRIIDHMISTGEWGEFFPHELSPFGYNETVAQEYFPMTEEEVKKMPRFEQWSSPGWPASRSLGEGWNWYSEEKKSFDGPALQSLPISEYDERVVGFEVAQKNIDTLLAGVVKCEVTGKPFKIIKQELAFYIEHSLPIPTKHPDQRHKERMDMRNPRTLYERTCCKCHTDIITTYSPDRPERVVCEECYRKLVY